MRAICGRRAVPTVRRAVGPEVLSRYDQSRSRRCTLCSFAASRRAREGDPSHLTKGLVRMNRLVGLLPTGRTRKVVVLATSLVLAVGAVAIAAPSGLLTENSGGP